MEVLREVALVNPLEYDQQQRDDAAGIRNVSSFVQELTERYFPKSNAGRPLSASTGTDIQSDLHSIAVETTAFLPCGLELSNTMSSARVCILCLHASEHKMSVDVYDRQEGMA